MKSDNKIFSVLGGDKRSYYLAKALIKEGYCVRITGFDMISKNSCSLDEALAGDILIFPVVPLDEGKNIASEYAEEPLNLYGKEGLLQNKVIFTGKKDMLVNNFPSIDSSNVFSYSEKEIFSVQNAVPTAEGAITEAIINSDKTLNGSKVLVCGYGRIGKVLSEMLRGIGAEVTISARKSSDLAWIKLNGFESAVTGKFAEIGKFDYIFNTVPSLIFDKEKISLMKSDVLLIDLASKPGGVDFKSARNLGVKAIHALALPGKYSPRAAGEIIGSTIITILKEEDG